MSCRLIKQIIDKYFIYDPEIYKKWISVHDLYIYESWLKGKTVVDTTNVVSVDHDRMRAKLEEMNLKFPPVCRILGFSDNYGAEIKYRGVCNRKFLEKFCELTNTQPDDYITAGKEAEREEVSPELLENIGECASEILRSVQTGVDSISRVEAGIDNVDAGIVGVLKELQKMTKQLMLISKALGDKKGEKQ